MQSVLEQAADYIEYFVSKPNSNLAEKVSEEWEAFATPIDRYTSVTDAMIGQVKALSINLTLDIACNNLLVPVS